MNTPSDDRWSALDSAEAVQAAADRLRQMSDTAAERNARQQWVDLLSPGPGERILDVGAGLGDMSLQIAQHVRPHGMVQALDLSAGLLDHASRQAREMNLQGVFGADVGDASALPYSDDVFDAAFSRWLLLHVANPGHVISEMYRVVRPGGRLLCVEADWETLSVHPGDPEVTWQIAQANVRRQVDGRVGRKLVPLLRAAGLQDVSVSPVVALDLTGEWIPFLRSRLAVAADAGVAEDALETWWQAISVGVRNGQYFFSFTQYGAIGTVPPHRQNDYTLDSPAGSVG